MKHELLYCLCLGLLSAAFATSPDYGPHWKAVEGGVYQREYSGKDWPGIRWNPQLTPGTWYRLSCEVQSSVATPPAFCIALERGDGKGQAYTPFVVGRNWTPCVLYFYCREPDLLCRIRGIGTRSADLRLRNLSIRALTEQDFAENLLPDGGFEAGEILPPFWKNAWRAKAYRWRIVPNSDFFAGTKNLEISFVPKREEPSGLVSQMLPVRPGHEYECRFWAKTAEKEYLLGSILQLWTQFGPHTGKHHYVRKSFKLTPEWRECVIRLTVPEDDGSIPDLRDRVANLQFFGEEKRGGTVRIAAVSVREVK